MKKIVLFSCFFISQLAFSQSDSTKLKILAYLDTYYAYDASLPASRQRAYFVSSDRHNELSINIAALGAYYETNRFRSKILLGFGSYLNSNYAAEPQTLKNLLEAYVGIKLSKKTNMWLDVGVIGSPFSSENAFSTQQTMYSRSFAPEYVPYYLSAIRLGVPLSKTLTWYAWITNGWQQIQDVNPQKSFISQLEFRPNTKFLFNWNLCVGSENSQANPSYRTRYFFDIYAYYTLQKFSANACFYIGNQKSMLLNSEEDLVWWQINLQAKYKLSQEWSIAGRLEYFDDPKSVQISSINPDTNGFSAGSFSLGLNYTITENLFLRFEGRNFFSNKAVFRDEQDNPKNMNQVMMSSLAFSF